MADDYGGKEKGYSQPYDDYVDEMLTYIDTYATDEISNKQRREMLKDAQVKMAVELIKEAVISSGWEIHYDWDEDKALGTEMVNHLYEVFDRLNENPWSAGGLDDVLERWMDALWFRKMVCELVFEHDKINEYIFIKKAKVLPPESIFLPIDRFGNLEAIIQYPYAIDTQSNFAYNIKELPPEAVEIDMNKAILWVNGDDYSQYNGRSELDAVYKYWFLKDFILRFWSMFVERFGAPLIVSFVKAKNMKAARDSMKTILTNTAFAMEQEDKIEMLEPKKEGKVFESMISYCDNEISKGLLVPTLLGGTGEDGAKSLGDIHFKMFEYRIHFIQRKLENLNRALIKKEIDLNYQDVKHYPVFTFKPFTINYRMKMAQTFDLLIKNAIVHPNEPWVRKELQLPEAEDRFHTVLDEAWRAKMTAGSGGLISGGMPSPRANITRTEAQPNVREANEIGDTTKMAEKVNVHIEEQLKKAEDSFIKKFVPSVEEKILEVIKVIENKIKNDKSIKFAEIPSWLNNLKFNFGFQSLFADLYNNVLVDIILEDNTYLQSLGMESAFDVQTRTGAFNWIDSKISDIKNGLLDYGSANANDLETRMLEDIKSIIQQGLDEGLSGRELVNRLSNSMLSSKYTTAQLSTIARTNTNAIINQGKKAFARENPDFVKGMTFYAVLDDRTTDLCEQVNEKEFALDDPALDQYTPPLHFNCRSVLDYIIDHTPTFDSKGITEEVPEGFGDV